jgi:hypothetical protein
MHWTKEEYTTVLAGLLAQFVATKKEARAAVVADAATQIKDIAHKEGYDVPEFLEKVLSHFIAICNLCSLASKEN